MFAKPGNRMQWWAVYVLVGIALGSLLEVIAAAAPFWSYNPRWLVFAVVILAFGLSPATLELVLRRRSLFVVFLAGSALAFLVEGLSALAPDYGWTFAPGFPLGINNVFWRTVILGFGGGLFILAAHAITFWIFVLVTKPDRDEKQYEQYRKASVASIPDPFDQVKKETEANLERKKTAKAFYRQLNPEGKKMILSVDGGGSKGYITLHCLAKLEELTGRKCSEVFDFFAGTSTGSLIAAGLAMGISAHKLRLIYRSKIPAVFDDRSPIMGLLADLFRPNDPARMGLRSLIDKIYLMPRNELKYMYRHDRLWKLVSEVLTDRDGNLIRMGDIDKHLLITIKDVLRGETIFAVNCGPGRKAFQNLPLAYAVMGSSVAPIFLQPFLRWVDGGVGTYTNPCYRATFVATRVIAGETNYGAADYDESYNPKNVIHFSFGTGVGRNIKRDDEASNTRAHEWLLYVVGEGLEDSSDDQVRMTQEHFARGDGVDFRRFQIMLDPEILAVPVPRGGLGMDSLNARDEETERTRGLIEHLEMDAHDAEQLRIMEQLGKAWAEALASNPDGKGVGLTRPHYPYVDPIRDPKHPDAKKIYFPPATPPQSLPSYLLKEQLPHGLRDYRNRWLPRMTDKIDARGKMIRKGYITEFGEELGKVYRPEK